MDDLIGAVIECNQRLQRQQKIDNFKQSIISIVTFPVEAIILIILAPFLGIARIIQEIKN
jgi:hypothetical protein